ncbi:MAG: hypothetical protein EOM35_02230 [Negativicutes bacterium]|nr:hypothetical protein [Negativicutes bacterium]
MVDIAYGTGNEEGLPQINLPSFGDNSNSIVEDASTNIPSITVRPSDANRPSVQTETPVEPIQPTVAPISSQSYSSEIQEALANGYTGSEVKDYLRGRGLSEDDADLAVVESVKAKVNAAKAEGYSEEEISSFMSSSGYEPDLINYSLKAAKLDDKYKQLDYKPDELSEEDKAMEISELYTNIYSKYSTLGKQVVGIFDDDMALEARREVNKLNYHIAEKLKSEGIDAFIDDDSGDVMMRDENGDISEVESSFLQSIWNSKGEIGGAIAGGLAGAKAGAIAGSVVPGVGTGVGTVGGALIGSAVGSSLGRALDLTINAKKLSEDLSASLYMTQMKQAGIFDLTMGIVVPTTFKIGAKGYRGITKAWKYFSHGNPKGAYKALKATLDISDDEAKHLLNEWEKFNDTDALGQTFEEKAIYAISQTTQGAEGVVKTAAAQNARVTTMLKQAIDQRAKDVHAAVSAITDENTGALVRADLDAYKSDVKQFFDVIKKQGSAEIDGTDFVFDLDKTAIVPVMKNIEKKLSNPVVRERFVSYATRIEEASKDRSFSGLLELRSAVNDFKYSKTLATPDLEALNTVINKIDGQIGKAVKEYMPSTGKDWLRNFKKAKVEYAKMKQLEENALYRQLMRPGATEENLQKSLSKYGNSADVDTEIFNKVTKRLSPTVKVKVEGAAIKNALNRWTDGLNTEAQAINFPALAAELNGLNLQTKTAKDIRKVVQEFANIYKNDKNLADIATQFNARKPANSISTSYVQKGMFAIVGQTWEAFYRYLPTRGARNLALVHYLAKVLDNPLNVKTVDEFVKQLPVEKQAEMRSLVKDLQVQMAKQGPQAPKATVNMYKQTKTGSLAVTNGTMGKGIYLVDKVKAPNPDSKIVKQVVTVSEMATLDDISTLVGKNVTLKDIRTIPNLQKQLEDKGFKGIKVEDKAMLFPGNTTIKGE